MVFRLSILLPIFLAFLNLASGAADALASREEASAFSTFVYATDHGNLTFSVNAANSTGDIFFHLSAPATYQWVSVGTGSEMDGSVMWVVYESSESNGLTLSPRLSDGHVEPSFSDSVNCALVEGADYHNGIVGTFYTANIHCKTITALGKGEGKLDLTKTKQEFLYAWGPTDESLSTTSQTAGLRRHEAYGTFWMDMTKATSAETEDAAVPSGTALSTTTNAGADGSAESDSDKVGPAHAVLMCGAFALIFPLGAVLLRLLESVKAHYIVQTIGALASLIGVGVGIYLSKMYNHSKDISSGHQIWGLVVFVLALLQWSIGLYHHLQYRKYQRPTAYGKVHLYAGPAIVLGGIINGFTGFNFSGEPHNNVFYGPIVGVIIVVVVLLLGWKRWSKRRQKKNLGHGRFATVHDGGGEYGLNAMGTSDRR
ncbi:iron reductase domain protein [Lentithecium fluviatile CBS 122367]|uniref:Iron reductase domain protein n=1 Tax=Lentithecium fluviatile CBS 122367 TaxID=1168545 RepID=A0A6G1IWG3_9PLEO|nr:iron reductase domain protein [Lentithecium fluviatile CBS 122367]